MASNSDIHLVYSTDANYLEPIFVSAASAIYFHTAPGRLFVHFFLEKVPAETYEAFKAQFKRFEGKRDFELVAHVWDPMEFDRFPKWNNTSLIYVRMVLAERLQDVDWAIACDGDTLWLSDPAELLSLRDESKLFLASIDPPPSGSDGINRSLLWFEKYGMHMPQDQYYCAGFLLLNLRLMREEAFCQKCIDFLDKYPDPPLCEQMVICYVGIGKTVALPPKWGVFAGGHWPVDLSQGGVIHYVQTLPTRFDKINRLLSDVVLLWYEFCKRVLGENRLPLHLSWWGRFWRRTVFVILKHNQWIENAHPYLKAHLHTRGMPKQEWNRIMETFKPL